MRLAESYVWFNPHLTLRGTWHGQEFINVAATNPTWEKWGPRNPTSAHWYDETRLQRYLAAHVARDRDLRRQRTVREFIAEFRGLSGTAVQRKVLEEVGCSHKSLAQFFGIEQVNRAGIAKLLASMRKHTKPVAAKHLGVIGDDHLKQRFLAAGGNAETFKYQQRKGTTNDGIPYIIEFAFGLHQSGLTQGASVSRKFITGANWSVGINNPFRAFGSTGEGLESTLAKVRANASQPVICALHLASAYIQYADRGKSSIILTDNASSPMTKQPRPRNIANDILDAVETATSKWTRQKKSEEKHPGMIRYRMSRMTKEPRTTQKDAAWQIMEASLHGRERQRHAAGHGATNLLPSASENHATDRR